MHQLQDSECTLRPLQEQGCQCGLLRATRERVTRRKKPDSVLRQGEVLPREARSRPSRRPTRRSSLPPRPSGKGWMFRVRPWRWSSSPVSPSRCPRIPSLRRRSVSAGRREATPSIRSRFPMRSCSSAKVSEIDPQQDRSRGGRHPRLTRGHRSAMALNSSARSQIAR